MKLDHYHNQTITIGDLVNSEGPHKQPLRQTNALAYNELGQEVWIEIEIGPAFPMLVSL